MSELIIKDPITVHPDDTLETVNLLINREGFSHLPVIQNDKLVGVINKSDLSSRYLKIMEKNDNCEKCVSDITVSEIMNTQPICAYETDSVEVIADKFIDHNIQGLIIIDGNRKLKGLITSFDLLDHLLVA